MKKLKYNIAMREVNTKPIKKVNKMSKLPTPNEKAELRELRQHGALYVSGAVTCGLLAFFFLMLGLNKNSWMLGFFLAPFAGAAGYAIATAIAKYTEVEQIEREIRYR